MFSFKFADRIFRIWRHQATMIMDYGTNNDGNSNATERNIGKMGYPLMIWMHDCGRLSVIMFQLLGIQVIYLHILFQSFNGTSLAIG